MPPVSLSSFCAQTQLVPVLLFCQSTFSFSLFKVQNFQVSTWVTRRASPGTARSAGSSAAIRLRFTEQTRGDLVSGLAWRGGSPSITMAILCLASWPHRKRSPRSLRGVNASRIGSPASAKPADRRYQCKHQFLLLLPLTPFLILPPFLHGGQTPISLSSPPFRPSRTLPVGLSLAQQKNSSYLLPLGPLSSLATNQIHG